MFKFKLDIIGRITTVAVAILIVACSVSLVTLAKRGVRPELKQPAEENSDIINSTAALEETVDYGENYVNTIIFLGDTTISHMREANVLFEGENSTQIWSDEEGHLLLSSSIDKAELALANSDKTIYLTDAAEQIKPDYLLITVGLENGVRYCTEEQFKAYYTKLIEAIKVSSPTTKIILNSIFPVSKKYEKSTQGISMDKIDTANSWIVEIAEEQEVKYLHSTSVLKDKNGYLDPQYDSGDGLHLNAEGYNVFFMYIRTHGYKSSEPQIEE